MIRKILGFFKKNQYKSMRKQIAELSKGDLIFLEYKHPLEIGILDKKQTSLTRLNKEEIDKRKYKGVVTNIIKQREPYLAYLIEFETYESPALKGKPRKFLLFEDEIKRLKKIA